MTDKTDQNGMVVRAHLAILFANVAWGLMSPFSKDILLSGAISGLALSGLRIFGGALLFLIFSFILPKSMEANQHIERKDWWKIFLCSILMISANQGLFIIGIGFTNPIDSSVMSSLTPILTMILAALILKFPITWLKGVGVGIGLAGALLLVSASGSVTQASNPVMGDTLCFTAQMCAAIYYVVFREVIMKYSSFTLMKWMFLLSAVTYVPFSIPDILKINFGQLPSYIWLELAYIVCFATFLGYLCIPFSQKYLKPTMVSMYNYLQPVFATVMAIMLGVGDFTFVKVMAALMIFAGVYFVNLSSSRKTIFAHIKKI